MNNLTGKHIKIAANQRPPVRKQITLIVAFTFLHWIAESWQMLSLLFITGLNYDLFITGLNCDLKSQPLHHGLCYVTTQSSLPHFKYNILYHNLNWVNMHLFWIHLILNPMKFYDSNQTLCQIEATRGTEKVLPRSAMFLLIFGRGLVKLLPRTYCHPFVVVKVELSINCSPIYRSYRKKRPFMGIHAF